MKAKDELAVLGKRVLGLVKNELYMDMPYLARPIGNLSDVMDLSTRTVGTDGISVRFHPQYVCETYLSRPGKLNRTYMHMLLHNLLLHPYVDVVPMAMRLLAERQRKGEHGTITMGPEELQELWNLSCDITVESIVDSMEIDGLRIISSEFRENSYQRFQERIRTFTAERIFRELIQNPPPGEELLKMEEEFLLDDHSFWERLRQSPKVPPEPEDINHVPMTNLPLKEVWEKTAEAVRLEAERSGSDPGKDTGRLTWSLKLSLSEKKSYRHLLERFMQRREVAKVDPDAFDLAYYTYGMNLYGDMPLMEEQEGREETRLESLVIAIDTSASTKQKHVKKFLEETFTLLRGKDIFFERSRVFLVECDDRVQRVLTISSPGELWEYADHFEVSGGYGTDFRPLFTYVKDRVKAGEMKELRAVLYFTDGYGTYPKKPGSFETVFVFLKDEDYDDSGVPDWAGKVYI